MGSRSILFTVILIKCCSGRREIIREILLASIIYIVFKMLIRVFNIPGNHDIFSVGRCLEMWPYFMLGFFTRKYNLLTYIHRYPAIASIAAITFIITFFGAIEYCGYNLGRFYKLASATMLVFLLYVFSSRENMKTKLENQLALIGRYSLEVYIFHYPQFRNPTNSLRPLRSKPPRMRFLLFKQAFCHILTDMSA